MGNRVHIDARAGKIEVEGEKDFVEEQVEKLLPLIERFGFGSDSEPHASGTDTVDDQQGDIAERRDEQSVSSGRRQKRRVARAPKGHSCADRILILLQEGFFKDQRTVPDVVTGLAKKGWTHKTNQAAAALGNMFKRNDIQRTKGSGDRWEYYWDRG